MHELMASLTPNPNPNPTQGMHELMASLYPNLTLTLTRMRADGEPLP